MNLRMKFASLWTLWVLDSADLQPEIDAPLIFIPSPMGHGWGQFYVMPLTQPEPHT